jgi:hypothetical protein
VLPLGLLVPLLLVAVGAAPAQDGPAEATSIRFVHAVPGAGEAEVSLNGGAAGSVQYGGATSSLSLPAGRAELEVTFPEGAELSPSQTLPEGAALAASRRLEAGGSYTAVALPAEREGGVRVRFFRASPEARPATGAGGGGVPWPLVILAVACGAALGIAAYRLGGRGRYRQPP